MNSRNENSSFIKLILFRNFLEWKRDLEFETTPDKRNSREMIESGLPFFNLFKEQVNLIKDSKKERKFIDQYWNCFGSWKKILKEQYNPDKLRENLYINHAYIVFISFILLESQEIKWETIPNLEILDDFLDCFAWLDHLKDGLKRMRRDVEDLLDNVKDLFIDMYPRLLPRSTKHSSGEYYTNNELARLMVRDSYKPGMAVLDPSCGSGTFLIEIINAVIESSNSYEDKCRHIKNIYGIDKNIIAIFMSIVNIKLVLKIGGFTGTFPMLYIADALFFDIDKDESIQLKQGSFDLIIGNPPWIVLGAVESDEYKESLKRLATDLDIYMGGKNAANLEVSILFLYKFYKYLKNNGWVFFILPNSIVTAMQHDKARIFRGFSHVEIWGFSHQPFNIHSISLRAKKNSGATPRGYKIPFINIIVNKTKDGINFQKGKKEIFKPVHVETKHGAITAVKRLIPSAEKKKILKLGVSPYLPRFYKGAQIFPRHLLFVDIIQQFEEDGEVVSLVAPSKRVHAKKHSRWKFIPYQASHVENKYIFKIAKSTALVPFKLLDTFDAFLPFKIISRGAGKKQMILDPDLPKFARIHFQMLESIYREKQKSGASHESLVEIINYQNCLSNFRQMAPIKIIYNGGGSIVKAAIIKGPIIVDYSMFYYPVENEEEGYYLLGYLNSPSLVQSVKMVGSTGYSGSLRNIVKHPLNFSWPLFDPNNPKHLRVVKQARLLEEIVNKIIAGQFSLENDECKQQLMSIRLSIQNKIFSDREFKKEIRMLDDAVISVINEK
ncbi:MAG: HsdM family class I SAM-dependent methyltransferase [Promethearchaeota archaeon]